ELVAVKLGETPMALWASRAYISRRGHPKTVAALADHDAIAFDRDTLFESAFRAVVGDLPESRIALRTDSHAASLRALLAGVGVGALQRIIAARYPELVEVASDATLPHLEVWLVTARDLRRARAIRAAFDHLRDYATALLSTPPLKRRRAP
ncbi:MAG TPA: LysR substrate-binding domain-containing protein, partial [Myxococcota bacterium]|nr:LysR substrate-binding domain-containing protein [Myxococcota bacterium]